MVLTIFLETMEWKLPSNWIESRLYTAHFHIPHQLNEQSIPWNREQTDSLTQVITEAGPRYQINMAGPQGVGLLICIDPEVNKQILGHLDRNVQAKSPMLIPEGRAPPSFGLFD